MAFSQARLVASQYGEGMSSYLPVLIDFGRPSVEIDMISIGIR